MKHLILLLLGKLSLSHIVADFESTLAKLEAHVARKNALADAKLDKSSVLARAASAARTEAGDADRIRANIATLLGK